MAGIDNLAWAIRGGGGGDWISSANVGFVHDDYNALDRSAGKQ